MTITYDLLTQPWIPCVRADGDAVTLGLQDTLAEAHTLRELGGESPLVTAALYRLLLAVLHRVYDGPADPDAWSDLWESRQFDAARLRAYCDRWRDRFDLFHPERPFYQAPDDRVKPKSITALVHHVASGNNATLFDHHTDDGGLTLTPPEAARMVVVAQSFGMGGLSGIPRVAFTGAPWVGGIIFLMQGRTLFETLVLNMLPYNEEVPPPCHRSRADRPAWEQDDPFLPEREVPHGYLDYLTWQNRRVLLFPEEMPAGIGVREMTVAPALRLEQSILDPQMHYRNDERRGPLALRFNEDRALWRDSAAIFELRGSAYRPPLVLNWLGILRGNTSLRQSDQQRMLALGMANDRAKVEFYRSEQWPLPLAYLDEQTGPVLVEALQQITKMAEDVSSQLWGAMRTLAQLILNPESDLEGGQQPDPKDLNAITNQWDVKRRYWSRLEIPFRQTLEQVPQDKDAALTGWQETLRRTAWDAFNSIAEDLANDPRALKAYVKAQGQLAGGLKKVLPQDEDEEIQA